MKHCGGTYTAAICATSFMVISTRPTFPGAAAPFTKTRFTFNPTKHKNGYIFVTQSKV